jgi:hypothetical protein
MILSPETSYLEITAPRTGAIKVLGQYRVCLECKGGVLYAREPIKLRTGEGASHDCLVQPIKALETKPV